MAVYEKRLAEDLAKIREKVAAVGVLVEDALKRGVQAVMTGDRHLANAVILGDHNVNRAFADIDSLCHKFLALHLPTAGHLRLISSVLRMNGEMERIGDHAATIAREALQMSEPPDQSFKAVLETISGDSQNMLRRAVKAFNENDADAARETMSLVGRVVTEFDRVFHDLADATAEAPEKARDLLYLSVVYSKLERISARAENICEETVFATTGETPERKKFNVLFLDERNNGQSRIAEAVGNKMAREVCSFSSAGRSAASGMHPGLPEFMEAHGLVTNGTGPRAIDPKSEEVATYDVVVALDGPASSYISSQPFRTVFLDWDVGTLPEGTEKTETVNRYYDIYRELTVQIRNLVETLHGEEP